MAVMVMWRLLNRTLKVQPMPVFVIYQMLSEQYCRQSNYSFSNLSWTSSSTPGKVLSPLWEEIMLLASQKGQIQHDVRFLAQCHFPRTLRRFRRMTQSFVRWKRFPASPGLPVDVCEDVNALLQMTVKVSTDLGDLVDMSTCQIVDRRGNVTWFVHNINKYVWFIFCCTIRCTCVHMICFCN